MSTIKNSGPAYAPTSPPVPEGAGEDAVKLFLKAGHEVANSEGFTAFQRDVGTYGRAARTAPAVHAAADILTASIGAAALIVGGPVGIVAGAAFIGGAMLHAALATVPAILTKIVE